MTNNFLDKSIDILNIEAKTINILSNNNIKNIKDLWGLNRKQLKKMSLSDGEINNIIIKMQLLGIDLNKKVYHDK